MLADVTQRGAVVWVQTEGAAEVRVVATPAEGPAEGEAPPAVEAVAATTAAGTASVRLFGLMPGTTYDYAVFADGVDVTPGSYPTALTTQPLWQYREDPPTFTAAFGSCYFNNDPLFDRPGRPYGGSTGVFESIRQQAPDLMLWLGDNVYLREVDWWSPEGIDYRYGHARAEPDLQPLLATAAHYATWDDHDYGPNNSDRSYIHKGAALETFADFWPNPTYGLPSVPGTFTQFEWADAEFFVLDNRYHRSPNDAPARERTILGAEQLQWLLDALTASRAPFKFVVMGGQVLNPVEVFENYVNVAPAERAYLLDQIAERRIDGVVILSGDRHHGELMRMERPGTYPLYEFTSSPLTAGAVATPRDSLNPIRVPGTLVAGVRNFGTLTVSGPRTDRVLTMRAFSADGEPLWEHTVRADDLRTPAEAAAPAD
jgi:alkaline phosphatase D